MSDVVISTVAMLMKPYLAVQADVIFGENEVGDAMFIVISGEVKLSSKQCPKYNGLAWLDGAFIGEPPLLAMGCGPLKNRHVYTARSVVETDLSFLPMHVLEQVEVDFPELRKQIRRLAKMRANRFGDKGPKNGDGLEGGGGRDGDGLELMRLDTPNATPVKRGRGGGGGGMDRCALPLMRPSFTGLFGRVRVLDGTAGRRGGQGGQDHRMRGKMIDRSQPVAANASIPSSRTNTLIT